MSERHALPQAGVGGHPAPASGTGPPVSPRAAGVGFLLIALVWGGTFPVVKQLVEAVPPLSLLAGRFGAATLVLAGFALARRRAWRPQVLIAGVLIGVVFGAGYFLQTVGLQYTTASKAGFITALNVVFIPVLAKYISGRRSTWVTWLGVAVATLGLAVMTVDWSVGLRPETGDLFVLACAVMFALHIVLIDRFAGDFDPVLLTFVQVVTVTVLSFGAAHAFEGGFVLATDGANVGRLLFLAVFATAGAVLTQVSLQRFTTPARVGLILSMEPVFAALFAWLLLGETMTATGWFGGALVLAGVLLSEFGPSRPASSRATETVGPPGTGGRIAPGL